MQAFSVDHLSDEELLREANHHLDAGHNTPFPVQQALVRRLAARLDDLAWYKEPQEKIAY